MSYDCLCDALERVCFPGMGDLEWEREDDGLVLRVVASDIFTLTRENYSAKGNLATRLRWGCEEAMCDAITYWHGNGGVHPNDPFGFWPRLANSCAVIHPCQNINMAQYVSVINDEWTEDFLQACDAVLEASGNRYDVEVRHTLSHTDEGWHVHTQVGFGWADMWAFEVEFYVPYGATNSEIWNLFERVYPRILW